MSYDDQGRLGISGRVIADAVAEQRAALVCYLSVGYPTVDRSMDAFQVVCDAGTDIVEIGIPYSDPVMDGPVIQRAATQALAGGVRTRDAFRAAETVAAAGKTPVVMTYWNLVEQYGPEAFARDLASAGGAGVITPDLVPDEADEWMAASDAHGMDRIFLIAPSSSNDRIASTMRACRGWVYATSVMGVTGIRASTSDAAPVIVQRARDAVADIPVGVGLGVSNADQAAEIGAYADAVIVGSALLRTINEDGSGLGALERITRDLVEGVRRARS